MHTVMDEGKYDASVSRAASTSEPVKGQRIERETVSTAAVRVGLAHLVHEINNRLQFIYNAFSVMEMDMGSAQGCVDTPIDEVVHGGKTAIKELISLVWSLRAQLESLWQINPSLQTLDLRSLVEKILQSEALRLESCGICLVKEMAAGLPLIEGNKRLLEVALRNIFKNALEAMPEGGNLTVIANAHDSSVRLEIADSGVGIPSGLEVFQPFATSKSGGMGLGLAIVRHVVEIHGGTINYRSEPNEGTTFCIIFPLRVDANNASVSGKLAEV